MPAVQLAPRTSKLEFYIGGTKINYKQLNNSNLDQYVHSVWARTKGLKSKL